MDEVDDPCYLANSLHYWQRRLWWYRFALGKDPGNTQVQFALNRCRARRAQLRSLLNVGL